MADASGLGNAAKGLVNEMKQALKTQELPSTHEKGINHGGVSPFQQMMQNQSSQSAKAATEIGGAAAQNSRVVTSGSMEKILKEAQRADKLSTTRIGSTEKAAESKLSKMLQGLITGQDKMTKIMDMALSGRQFSPSDLLAMQAGIYRFSQELDLSSKIIEKATGGIKQTLNTQV